MIWMKLKNLLIFKLLEGIASLKDEIKKKKSFLKRYRNYLIRIERLEEKLLSIDNQLEGMSSKRISDMPTGGVPVTVDDLLVRKEETKQRIKRIVRTSNNVKSEIYEVIDQIDDYRFSEVLEAYFIDGKTMEHIAEERDYSVKHIKYLYSKGIKEIQISDDDDFSND